MTTLPVLLFDALQQLQCFTLKNCPGFGYNWDPKAMHRYTRAFRVRTASQVRDYRVLRGCCSIFAICALDRCSCRSLMVSEKLTR